MNPNLQDIDLIHRYLDRSLSDEEKVNLEKRLKEEPEFNTLYREHQMLVQGIRYSGLQEKLNQLRVLESVLPETVHVEDKKRQIRLHSYWKPLLAVAASLALFVVLFFLWKKPVDHVQLFAQEFKAYPNIFEPIVRSDAQPINDRTEAFAAYEARDYQKAATLFKKLLQEKEEPGVLLLLGNANLILGNTSEARNNFITLINNFDEYDTQAKWYLGLSYLKDGDVKSAQLILQEVSNSEFSYASKAKELLKQIE
jgi:tetratricopeptide (TPR) repeat protein